MVASASNVEERINIEHRLSYLVLLEEAMCTLSALAFNAGFGDKDRWAMRKSLAAKAAKRSRKQHARDQGALDDYMDYHDY